MSIIAYASVGLEKNQFPFVGVAVNECFIERLINCANSLKKLKQAHFFHIKNNRYACVTCTCVMDYECELTCT